MVYKKIKKEPDEMQSLCIHSVLTLLRNVIKEYAEVRNLLCDVINPLRVLS